MLAGRCVALMVAPHSASVGKGGICISVRGGGALASVCHVLGAYMIIPSLLICGARFTLIKLEGAGRIKRNGNSKRSLWSFLLDKRKGANAI